MCFLVFGSTRLKVLIYSIIPRRFAITSNPTPWCHTGLHAQIQQCHALPQSRPMPCRVATQVFSLECSGITLFRNHVQSQSRDVTQPSRSTAEVSRSSAITSNPIPCCHAGLPARMQRYHASPQSRPLPSRVVTQVSPLECSGITLFRNPIQSHSVLSHMSTRSIAGVLRLFAITSNPIPCVTHVFPLECSGIKPFCNQVQSYPVLSRRSTRSNAAVSRSSAITSITIPYCHAGLPARMQRCHAFSQSRPIPSRIVTQVFPLECSSIMAEFASRAVTRGCAPTPEGSDCDVQITCASVLVTVRIAFFFGCIYIIYIHIYIYA